MDFKKKLYRSNKGMIAGVCAGIADYFDIDPTIVRVAYIVLTLCTLFSGVIAYFILCLVIPKKPL